LVSTYKLPELGQYENYILYLVAKGSPVYDMLEELKKAHAREWSEKYEKAQARVEDKRSTRMYIKY
jgi:trehalose/maltose hydrolase-like predicted phosphorylase